MKRPIELRRAGKALLKATGILLLAPFLYFVSALIGGLIPANPGWQPAASGVRVFVRTNGVHTWIMMPKVAAGIDWRPIALPEHIEDIRYAAGDHIAVGYGNRDFYLNTPTWGIFRCAPHLPRRSAAARVSSMSSMSMIRSRTNISSRSCSASPNIGGSRRIFGRASSFAAGAPSP
jgi:hypothetical protein